MQPHQLRTADSAVWRNISALASPGSGISGIGLEQIPPTDEMPIQARGWPQRVLLRCCGCSGQRCLGR